MIFIIQTNDEVSGLDITNLLNFAHIEHTILSKQHDEAAQQSVQRTFAMCAPEYHAELDEQGDRFCRMCGQPLSR